MYRIVFFLACLIVNLTYSCTKKEEPIFIEAKQESEVEIVKAIYIFDGKAVNENPLEFSDENIYIGITGKLDEVDDKKGIVTIYAFSSKEEYIKWGNDNGFPVALKLEIAEHLSTYAIEKGVIDEYERTGVVPQSYIKYERQYYERMMSSSLNQAGTRGYTMLHKECIGGPSAPIISTLPVMWPGWNNKVSAYFDFNVWGNLTIFDRTFYRKKLASIWDWGWKKVCFTGPLSPLDNKMSSGF